MPATSGVRATIRRFSDGVILDGQDVGIRHPRLEDVDRGLPARVVDHFSSVTDLRTEVADLSNRFVHRFSLCWLVNGTAKTDRGQGGLRRFFFPKSVDGIWVSEPEAE